MVEEALTQLAQCLCLPELRLLPGRLQLRGTPSAGTVLQSAVSCCESAGFLLDYLSAGVHCCGWLFCFGPSRLSASWKGPSSGSCMPDLVPSTPEMEVIACTIYLRELVGFLR